MQHAVLYLCVGIAAATIAINTAADTITIIHCASQYHHTPTTKIAEPLAHYEARTLLSLALQNSPFESAWRFVVAHEERRGRHAVPIGGAVGLPDHDV